MDPLIIIAGPTAVGKSDLSVKLAKIIGGEIISADSMQVYKGMDIGSAKITLQEMDGVPHHLIDVLEPTDEFNVALFQKLAKKSVSDILHNGHIPIICGGTGFYIQSVLYDIDFESSQGEISDYRQELETLSLEGKGDLLYEMLLKVDPVSANSIHPNNHKRIIRALEYYHETNTPISIHNETERNKPSAYNSAYFVLNDKRDIVYEKIDKRVDVMISNGLIEEVKKLKNMGLTKESVSMQGLGYKEILMYLDNEITLDEAIYIIKRDSRHFAKRQLTWFNREPDIVWLNKYEFDYDEHKILDHILSVCKERNILNE